MYKWVGISTMAAAMIICVGVSAGTDAVAIEGINASETPFWQLHGAAPAAHDTDALAQLRWASRQTDSGSVVAAR